METVIGIVIGLSVSVFMEAIKNVTNIIGRMDKVIYKEIYKYFLYQYKKTEDKTYKKLLKNCDANMYPIKLETPDIANEFQTSNKVVRGFIELERKASLGRESEMERYSQLVFDAERARTSIWAYQMFGAAIGLGILLYVIGVLYWDFYVAKEIYLYVNYILCSEVLIYGVISLTFRFTSIKAPDTEPDCLAKRDLIRPVLLFNLFCLLAGTTLASGINVMWYISKGGKIENLSLLGYFIPAMILLTLISIFLYMNKCGPIFKKLNAIVELLGNQRKTG